MTSLPISLERPAPANASNAVRISRTEQNLSQAVTGRSFPWWLAGVVLVLYVSSVSHQWFHTPDSALYLMLGRNLASGLGYTLWDSSQVEVSPGFPCWIAGMTWLGLGSVAWLNAASLAMSLGVMALAYRVLVRIAPLEIARWTALVFCLSNALHHESLRLLTDVPFMLLVWLGLWCYLRGGERWLEVGTLALLAACTVRVPGVLVVSGAAAGLVWQPPTSRTWRVWANAGALVGALVVAAGIVGLYLLADTTASSASYQRTLTRILDKSALGWVTDPPRNLYNTGEHLGHLLTVQKIPDYIALLVCTLPALVGLWRLFVRGQRLVVCVTAVYLGGMLLTRPLIPRYLLPVAPIAILAYFEGIAWLVSLRPAWRAQSMRAVQAMAIVLVCMNVPKAVKATAELHSWQPGNSSYDETAQVEEAAAFLARHCAAREKFVSNSDQRRLSFLSGKPSIHHSERLIAKKPPKADQLASWSAVGVGYLVERASDDEEYRTKLATVCTRDGYPLVFESKTFRIYALLKKGR